MLATLADCRVSDDSGQRGARDALGWTAQRFGRPGCPKSADKFRTCNQSVVALGYQRQRRSFAVSSGRLVRETDSTQQ